MAPLASTRMAACGEEHAPEANHRSGRYTISPQLLREMRREVVHILLELEVGDRGPRAQVVFGVVYGKLEDREIGVLRGAVGERRKVSLERGSGIHLEKGGSEVRKLESWKSSRGRMETKRRNARIKKTSTRVRSRRLAETIKAL